MQPIKIFISSMQSEFAEERQFLCNYIMSDALLGQFFIPFIFEQLPAIDTSVQRAYLNEVEHCDIYLGLFGKQLLLNLYRKKILESFFIVPPKVLPKVICKHGFWK